MTCKTAYSGHSYNLNISRKMYKMIYKCKLLTAVLPCVFLVSCASTKSEQSEPVTEKIVTLPASRSCADHTRKKSNSDLPASITSSDDYFECGDSMLELQASNAPGSMPTGTGSVTLNDNSLAVSSVLVAFSDSGADKNHKSIQLNLHNGEFRQAEKRFQQFDDDGIGVYRHEIRFGVYLANHVLTVRLASSASNQYEYGTFKYIGGIEDINDQQYASSNLIANTLSIYYPKDSDTAGFKEETFNIESGHITILGERPEWSITVDLVLSNGNVITGEYLGDFIEVPVAEKYEP